jgi:hypothetical protein
MNYQDFRDLQETYLEVYTLDEKAVNWDTGRNASGSSPRDTAARRQAQFQQSPNPADQTRASQISAVRGNMRAAIKQTGSTSANQLKSAGPIASERFRNAAIRQRGGSPNSVPIKTVSGLKDANKPAQTRRSIRVRGGGSSAQGLGSPSGTTGRYQVGGSQGFGLSNIKLADHYDIYDIILSHLLDEGYAETPEEAEVIMVNMSEDWRESICEELTGERRERALKKGGYLADRVATGKEGQPIERLVRGGVSGKGPKVSMRTTTKAPTKRGGEESKGERKTDWSGYEADRGSGNKAARRAGKKVRDTSDEF